MFVVKGKEKCLPHTASILASVVLTIFDSYNIKKNENKTTINVQKRLSTEYSCPVDNA